MSNDPREDALARQRLDRLLSSLDLKAKYWPGKPAEPLIDPVQAEKERLWERARRTGSEEDAAACLDWLERHSNREPEGGDEDGTGSE